MGRLFPVIPVATATLRDFLIGSIQDMTAWVDLARRPAKQVNGPKGMWAAIIAVSWVGPVAYFVKGRRR